MNLQDIRKYYEYPVIDCCNLQGVEYPRREHPRTRRRRHPQIRLARLAVWRNGMAEQAVRLRPSATSAQSSSSSSTSAQKASALQDAQDFMECVICAFHETERRGEHQRPKTSLHSTTALTSSRALSFGLQIPQI